MPTTKQASRALTLAEEVFCERWKQAVQASKHADQ